MKKNLLFLIVLLVGCGSVVSSNESITSNGNSSSSLDTSLTSLKESITSSSSNIVSDTSANEEKIRNVNLINNYTAVHLEENEEARNNIFSI